MLPIGMEANTPIIVCTKPKSLWPHALASRNIPNPYPACITYCRKKSSVGIERDRAGDIHCPIDKSNYIPTIQIVNNDASTLDSGGRNTIPIGSKRATGWLGQRLRERRMSPAVSRLV
jgi:hypothetical protein